MRSCDAAVIGGGPAGAAAARLLAAWNHRVILVHRDDRAGAALAESIPPSCRKLFAACGLADAVERAGLYRSTGNTVWWGSDEPRRERFAGGEPGYQVERPAFDAILRAEAGRAGADIGIGMVRAVAEGGGEGGVLRLEGGEAIAARFVLDCSGRAGVVARQGWRTDVASHPRTVALAAVWTSEAGWPGVDPTHTLVESYEDGWVWSVPLSPAVRYLTAMVDPQRTRLARGRPPAEVYRAELRKARHLAALVGDGEPARGPWGFDASVYAAATYAADPFVLVGDAASFIDPLSSYGIKKALASAWLAAVAVHTALLEPAMTGPALGFFAAREAAMAASLLRQSRQPFEEAAGAHAHRFWTDRVAAVDLPEEGEPDTRALREDPRVREAFAWLKAQPAVALRVAPTLRCEPSPIVRGHRIVLEDRLVAPACPEGLRFLRDVDLLGLLALAPGQAQVPALFDAYNRRFPPVALPDFLGALSVMLAFGLLEDSSASAG